MEETWDIGERIEKNIMKTIDEVINHIKICQKYPKCVSCPYHGAIDCTSKWGIDALYYLEQYKEVCQDLINHIQEHRKAERAYYDAFKQCMFQKRIEP